MGERGWLRVARFALCSWAPWCSRRAAEHPVSSFPLGSFRQCEWGNVLGGVDNLISYNEPLFLALLKTQGAVQSSAALLEWGGEQHHCWVGCRGHPEERLGHNNPVGGAPQGDV